MSRSPMAVREYLSAYVREVFPAAFSDQPSLMRFQREVSKHHRYLNVLSPSSESSDTQRIFTALQILTVQTMLMFVLAVFYDLQAPDDDGSCAPLTSESTCLGRKSFLDYHESYCQWNGAGQQPCSYRQPNFSYLTMAYIGVSCCVSIQSFRQFSVQVFYLLIFETFFDSSTLLLR